MPPRLRLIAGPNGSGKTTLTNSIRQKLGDKFGIYVNADEMEQSLRENQTLDLTIYGLNLSGEDFESFYSTHSLLERASVRWQMVDGLFALLEPLPALTYFPTLLADFVREMLLINKASFVFETVMSDVGKITLMQRAQAVGYKTYLYFVCIEDPLVNIERVADRVKNSGHHVPSHKILDRYVKSLANAIPAIKASSRAYFWDNSGRKHRFVAEITDALKIEIDPEFVPFWFEENILNKL